MKKLTLVASSLFLSLSLAAPALALPSDSISCPKVSNIQASSAKFIAKKLHDGTYFVFNAEMFQTSTPWLFAFAKVKANSSDEAVKVVTEKALGSLSGNPTPKPIPSVDGIYVCEYQNGYGYASAAESLTTK